MPAHLCTSPITIEVTEDVDEGLDGSSVSAGSGARRKKRRRKRMRSDTHLRDDNSSSDERERERESERGENSQTGRESPAEEELLSPLHVRSVEEDFCFLSDFFISKSCEKKAAVICS